MMRVKGLLVLVGIITVVAIALNGTTGSREEQSGGSSRKMVRGVNSNKYDNPLPLFGKRPGRDIVILVLDASSSMQDHGIHEQTQGIAYWNSDRFVDSIFKFGNVSYGKAGSPCTTCRDYAKETGIIPASRFSSELPENIRACLENNHGHCAVPGSHNDFFSGAWARAWCNSSKEPCVDWQNDIDGGCTGIYYPGPANIVVMKSAIMRMLKQFNSAYDIAVFTAADSSQNTVSVCGSVSVPAVQHGRLFDVDESIGNKTLAIQNLHAKGSASLGEILYEVYLYIKGENSHLYPNVHYESPVTAQCDRVHVIVISDGVFEQTLDTPQVVDTDSDGVVTDDVARKLATEDLAPEIPEMQSATVHSIYYILRNAPDKEYRTQGQAVMKDIANAGNGHYYQPKDVLLIEDQLDNIIGDNVRTRLDAYTTGTQSWDYYGTQRFAYLGRSDTFDNLGSIDTYLMNYGEIAGIYPDAQPMAASGTRLRARSFDDRVIYTMIPAGSDAGMVEFKVGAPHWKELREYLQTIWGEYPDGVTIEAMVNYIRGNDYYESWRHGDLRSRCWYGDCGGWKQAGSWQSPVFSSARPFPTGVPDESFAQFADEISNRGKVVFASANNGMIHCFREEDMEELWAFIAPGFLKELPGYAASRWYQKDITPRFWVKELRISTTLSHEWETFLVGAYGPTVPGLFALNVSDHITPKWLWEDTGIGTYLWQNVQYLYQMGVPGFPNRQGDAVLVVPTGYAEAPAKKIFVKHPVSGINLATIDLNSGSPASEIVNIVTTMAECQNPAQAVGNFLVVDDEGVMYDLSLCNLANPTVRSVSKPTEMNKKYGMWNYGFGKYSEPGKHYLLYGDGVLLKTGDISDKVTHTVTFSAPHTTEFPPLPEAPANYMLKLEQNNWLWISGKEYGKQWIKMQLPHAGEKLLLMTECSHLSHSQYIGRTVFYAENGCELRFPKSSLLIFPKTHFAIWNNKPYPEIRSEYFNHQYLTSYIDTNGDGIINANDLINNKKVFGKSFDGFISDIRRFVNIKKMTEHLNVVLIENEPDDQLIYHSHIEHMDIVAEPSYEIMFKKMITVPSIDSEEYPKD